MGTFSASISGDGGSFPLVSGVCLHMQLPTISDEIRGTSSPRGLLCIYAVEDNISIVQAAFMGLYFIHEFRRASEPHLTLCVYMCKHRKLFDLPTAVAGFREANV